LSSNAPDKTSTPRLSLVIPAYNEARRLPGTLEKLAEALPELPFAVEVVVADDGSEDATLEEARKFEGKVPGLRLLELPHGGKGSALQAAIRAARGEYVFLCDADLSMPLSELPLLLARAEEGYEVVIGWRKRHGESLYRRFRGRIFNWLVRLLLLPGVHDTQTGFKLFKRTVALEVYRHQRIRGFASEVEILLVARRLGYEIGEVRVDWYYVPGTTVRPFWDVLVMLKDLLRIRWWAWRGRYPKRTGQN